jgi:hypothetical protein
VRTKPRELERGRVTGGKAGTRGGRGAGQWYWDGEREREREKQEMGSFATHLTQIFFIFYFLFRNMWPGGVRELSRAAHLAQFWPRGQSGTWNNSTSLNGRHVIVLRCHL